MRLRDTEGLYETVKESMYELPIKVSFMLEQQDNFNEKSLAMYEKFKKQHPG